MPYGLQPSKAGEGFQANSSVNYISSVSLYLVYRTSSKAMPCDFLCRRQCRQDSLPYIVFLTYASLSAGKGTANTMLAKAEVQPRPGNVHAAHTEQHEAGPSTWHRLYYAAWRPAAHAPRVPVQVEQVHVARQAVRQHASRDGIAVQAAQAVDRRS